MFLDVIQDNRALVVWGSARKPASPHFAQTKFGDWVIIKERSARGIEQKIKSIIYSSRDGNGRRATRPDVILCEE
jgi:hypothetical protein